MRDLHAGIFYRCTSRSTCNMLQLMYQVGAALDGSWPNMLWSCLRCVTSGFVFVCPFSTTDGQMNAFTDAFAERVHFHQYRLGVLLLAGGIDWAKGFINNYDQKDRLKTKCPSASSMLPWSGSLTKQVCCSLDVLHLKIGRARVSVGSLSLYVNGRS